MSAIYLLSGEVSFNAKTEDRSANGVSDFFADELATALAQTMALWIGPRLKIRPLTPAPPLFVVGIAYRKDANSPITANFVAAAQRAKSA